ncbi:MAG: Ig-like domain-containing protein [Velocimicrobium sp.]
MRKIKTSKLVFVSMIFALVCSILTNFQVVQAAETATVRIISTTDLHGQLANTNYDTAGKKNVGSLAQDYTLIKEARSEVQNGTSITVDIGDTIYGYGSDYVYSNDGNEYMYAAIAKMKYDAITLGNHDFDYGYKYVEKQLKRAGLDDICVLSNVYDAVTGKNVWNENKILTKTLTTSKGNKVKVNIGIIGVTRPGLTNYYNHTGILTTKDILESVNEQVKNLKEKGVDLIVVIAHSSIGSADPEENSGDVAYAISKIDGVDAVMCGHGHLNFPSSDGNVQTYYKLPNVSKKTGLMNKKPVIMVADHGAGIGIADLKIKIKNGKVSVVSSKADIKYATKTTVSDSLVLKYQTIYDKLIKKTYSEEVGQMKNNTNITNYFGLLGDNAAIQLVNEAKIKLGLEYISTQNTDYIDCPVIAVSTYKKYGVETEDDYININGTITMADVLSIQSYYHDYSYVYWITGKQLREWLEWSASAYESFGSNEKSGDEIIDSYVNDMGMNSLIKKAWLGDWSNFFMFDGIEYTIDITQQAKYSFAGKVINSGASRIKDLTYNGTQIMDDTKMILVSDIITANRAVVGSSVAGQRLHKSGEYSANLLKSYIEEQSQFGELEVATDNNWKLMVPSSESYIIRSSSLSEDIAKNQNWYQDLLDISGNYAYYKGQFSTDTTDRSGPTLVVAPTITLKTNKDIPIVVQANDASTVTNLRYAVGLYGAKDLIWSSGVSANIDNHEFLATQNGTYSVWATDRAGNCSVKHIKVSNIDREVLQIPIINRVTNKSKRVRGVGEPGATIVIKANGKSYSTIVKEDGTFKRKIALQNADRTIKIKQKDANGKSSDYVAVTVLRAGPNYPIISDVDNTSSTITVDINDTNSQIYAFIGDKVYVDQYGGKEVYMKSFPFDSAYETVPSMYTRSGNNVSLTIPVQYAGTEIKIYAVDYIGRINYPIYTKVKEVAPEMPVLYTSCDGEHYVYGYVPESTGVEYQISITVDEMVYTGISNTKGEFKIAVDKLVEGQTVYASATDVVDNKIRESAKGSREVRSYNYYELENSKSNIYIEPMTNKDMVVKGNITNFSDVIYVKAGRNYYDLSIMEDGTFEIPLEDTLAAGEIVSVVLRKEFSNIMEAGGIVVQMALPDKPTLQNKAIYTTTKTLRIQSAENDRVNVKVGKKVYTTTTGVLDDSTGLYTYKVKIKRAKAKQTIYIYMENEAGYSKKLKMIVKEKKTEK